MRYKHLIEDTNMCVIPWVSLETSPIGTLRPCCLAIDEITDELGNKVHLNDNNLTETFNGLYLQKMRQQFINNERPETCSRCWDEEDAGRRSKRINTLTKFKHEVEDLDLSQTTTDQLWFLDLKLGNICNLKCRICGSWSSSKWAAEEIQYDVAKGIDKKDTFAYKMLKAGNWPRESEKFWDDLKKMLPTVRYFEFTGGEPFMIQEHFDLLKMAVDLGVAKNISLHYNTNATQLPVKALEEIWPEFANVEIAFSIDNLGERFEYERHGAKWKQANTTIDTFNRYREQTKNITTQLCFTINMFNCLYIDELLRWAEEKEFDYIHWNMLHDPKHFNVSYMPVSVKQLLLDSLQRKQTFKPKHNRDANALINFIQQDNKSFTGKYILDIVENTDKYRKENFSELYPELYQALINDNARV